MTNAKGKSKLTHIDTKGKAKMVDVGSKTPTRREAVAMGAVYMKKETLRLIMAKKTVTAGASRFKVIYF